MTVNKDRSPWIRLAGALLALSGLLSAQAPDAHASQPPPPRVIHWTLTSAADWQTGTLDGLKIVAPDTAHAVLTLDQGSDVGRFTSPVHVAPFPFTAAAVFWTADTQDGRGLNVEIHLSRDRLTWSPWYAIDHPETQPDGHTYGENVVAFDGAQFVQVRITWTSGALTQPAQLFNLTLVLMDTSQASTPAEARAAAASVRPASLDRPTIIPRQAWGADPAYLDWDPEYAPVQRVVVHHTVTAGGSNPVGEVQAIYYYHAVTRGWGDIGYNYLVDSFGDVYEGRYGGDDVIGAHTARWNTGALGISLLGCYDPVACSPGQSPTPAALDAIADLVAWTASRRLLDPRPAGNFANDYNDPPLTLYRLAGHRDYSQYLDGQWYNATTCPGDSLYNELTGLREEAWSRLPNDDARFEGHDTPNTIQPGQTLGVSLNLSNGGKVSWSPGDVYVGYQWFDAQGVLLFEETNAGTPVTEVPFAAWLPLTATLATPAAAGNYTLRWDMYRPGQGWFSDHSPFSQPLEVPVQVTTPLSQPHHLFLPLTLRQQEMEQTCRDVLVNGGAEENLAWEFIGGWPAAYSSLHVHTGERALRLGVEATGEDGYLYSSAQQIVGLSAEASQARLSFWHYSTSSNLEDDRTYVALLDSADHLLHIFRLETSDVQSWQPTTLDLTDYLGQTVSVRFTVLNQSTPGTTAVWLDDISLVECDKSKL